MNGVARLGVGIALVGRRAEMSALGAALEHAAEGKPTGILLAGDAAERGAHSLGRAVALGVDEQVAAVGLGGGGGE